MLADSSGGISVLMLARSGHFVYFTHTHKHINAIKTFRKYYMHINIVKKEKNLE